MLRIYARQHFAQDAAADWRTEEYEYGAHRQIRPGPRWEYKEGAGAVEGRGRFGPRNSAQAPFGGPQRLAHCARCWLRPGDICGVIPGRRLWRNISAALIDKGGVQPGWGGCSTLLDRLSDLGRGSAQRLHPAHPAELGGDAHQPAALDRPTSAAIAEPWRAENALRKCWWTKTHFASPALCRKPQTLGAGTSCCNSTRKPKYIGGTLRTRWGGGGRGWSPTTRELESFFLS